MAWVFVVGCVAPACGSAGEHGVVTRCEGADEAKLSRLEETTQVLEARVAAMRAELVAFCALTAVALGAPEPVDASDPLALDDDEVERACEALEEAVEAFDEPVMVTVLGGNCPVDHEAQLGCENAFSGGACGLSVIDRCDLTALVGRCTAACTGTCVTDPGESTACEGVCNGHCEGTCAGGCGGGACSGLCEGICSGFCAGECDQVAPAASCPGWCSACSAGLSQLRCLEPLSPPPCSIDSGCASLCEAAGLVGSWCIGATSIEIRSTDMVLFEGPFTLGALGDRMLEGAERLRLAYASMPESCAERSGEGPARVEAALASMRRWLGGAAASTTPGSGG